MVGYVYYDPYGSVRSRSQQQIEDQLTDAIRRLTKQELTSPDSWNKAYEMIFGGNADPSERRWRQSAGAQLRNLLFNAGMHDVLAGLSDEDVQDIAARFATSWRSALEKNAVVQPYEEGNTIRWTAVPGLQQSVSALAGFLRHGGREISPAWLNEQFAAEHQGSRNDLTTPEGRARLVEWVARKAVGASNVSEDIQKSYALDALENYIRNMIGGEVGRQLVNMLRNTRAAGPAVAYGALKAAYEAPDSGQGTQLSQFVQMLRQLAGIGR
jgi:hypothetical protein